VQACGASRDPNRDSGWVCDGTNLVALNYPDGPLRLHDGTTAVIRADLLSQASALDQKMAAINGTTLFSGGDHVHLVLADTRS
jgi:hypothetical protein